MLGVMLSGAVKLARKSIPEFLQRRFGSDRASRLEVEDRLADDGSKIIMGLPTLLSTSTRKVVQEQAAVRYSLLVQYSSTTV